MAAENLSQMIQSREYPLKVDTVMHTLLSDKHINFCAIFHIVHNIFLYRSYLSKS